MGNVVQLDEYRPHISGDCSCLVCGHLWVGTAPLGTTFLECPECGCFKGVFIFPVESDGPHWHCGICDNSLFYVTEDGIYCPNCGTWQEFE